MKPRQDFVLPISLSSRLISSHLAEAFFDGAEIWKNIILHHNVVLPLHPEKQERIINTDFT